MGDAPAPKRPRLNAPAPQLLPPDRPHGQEGRRTVVQLLCTNDTHSQLEPFALESYGGSIGGAARRAKVFADLRAQVPATLTLDAGDLFVGQPYWEALGGEAEMTVLAALGYDASAVGNHDFDGEGSGGPSDFGLAYLRRVAATHAPGVRLLCANVVDEQTGAAFLTRHAVFEPAPGVRVGVAGLFGEQAWDVTAPHLRKGLALADRLEAARVSAAELRALHCDVLVCLSHTGVDRGDKLLAELGLFDVIFSGHAHFYERSAFEQVDGPGGRLGLLSKGFALGGGVCWARLEVDHASRQVVDSASGVVVLDDPAHDSAIHDMVQRWKRQVHQALGLDEVFGECADELLRPDKHSDPWATSSPVHAALQHALREELGHRLQPGDARHVDAATLVVTNRYSAASGVKAGPVTRYDLMQLIRYDGLVALAEISGQLLSAMVRRNAAFVGQADFLYFTGVDFALCPRGGGPLPAQPLTREEISAGALECPAARVRVTTARGEMVDVQADGWYWAVVDMYVLDVLLAWLPERREGVRHMCAAQFPHRGLVEGYLRRGKPLRSPPPPERPG